jgi:hypothetical protein
MYVVAFQFCPHCGCPLEFQIFAVSSLLGPSDVNCLKCRNPVHLQRVEWLEMPTWTRIRYVAISLIYVFMVGLLTGNFIDQAFQLWRLDAQIVNLRYHSMVYLVSACVGGISVAFLQVYRVVASRKRSHHGYRLTLPDYLMGLQWLLHFKVLLLLIAIWGVAKIRYVL